MGGGGREAGKWVLLTAARWTHAQACLAGFLETFRPKQLVAFVTRSQSPVHFQDFI